MNKEAVNKVLKKIPLHLVIILIIIIWLIPTLGLFITSFRPVSDINTSGWWTILSRDTTGDSKFTLSNYIDALVGAGVKKPWLRAALSCQRVKKAGKHNCQQRQLRSSCLVSRMSSQGVPVYLLRA